jgi:hypothetical protein
MSLKENMQPSKSAPDAQAPGIDYRKSEAFKNEYANNVFMESTAWDLKFNFGQVDQSLGSNVVVQHTGITMPWPQVKVLLYFMQANIAIHELNNGHIEVPKNIIPSLPVPDKEMAKQFPESLDIYAALSKVRDNFIADNPEAVASKTPSHES